MLVIAHDESIPVEMATAVVFVPISMLVGAFLFALEPSPTCPTLFLPQQLTEPSVRMAQLWLLPSEIVAGMLLPRSTVPFDSEKEPRPSWP